MKRDRVMSSLENRLGSMIEKREEMFDPQNGQIEEQMFTAKLLDQPAKNIKTEDLRHFLKHCKIEDEPLPTPVISSPQPFSTKSHISNYR